MIFGKATRAFILIALALFFQACGEFQALRNGSGTVTLGSSGISSCDTTLQLRFENTYYRTAIDQNCQHCHTSKTASTASNFAEPNRRDAFTSFIQMGGSNPFDQYALSDHENGYTGSHLEVEIKNSREAWNSAVESFYDCVSNDSLNSTLVTWNQNVGVANGGNYNDPAQNKKTLTWDLTNESFAANLSDGASFEITVEVQRYADLWVYSFQDLKLTAGTKDLTFKEIDILINNRKVWTYDFGLQDIAAGAQARLATQPVFYGPPKGPKDSDQIKIGFRQLSEL